MALTIPFLGTVIVPGLAPALFLGLFIFCLALYRYKIEKDEDEKPAEAEQNVISEEEGKCCPDGGCDCTRQDINRVCILYGTTTGNAKDFAWQLAEEVEQNYDNFQVDVNNVSNIDVEEFLVNEAGKPRSILILIISTYTDGVPPESATWFYKYLEESATDFRVQHSLLKGLKFAVFGLGNSLYSDHFNTVARNCDKFLHQLSGQRMLGLVLGDENVDTSKYGNLDEDFAEFKKKVIQMLSKESKEVEESEAYEDTEEELDDEDEEDNDDLVDLEDLGKVMKKAKEKTTSNEPKEMLTPSLRKSLTKQGYKLIGSHSGVKICRWTKAMMRGRGGCYKHTFYGIESHRCMETTPSLACANKCVFCWRHHSNPVGTEWKWAMDEPELILNGALENHYKMIKQMKGVPGVLPERYEEGFKVRHCALSLVGEPIMYPEINRYVQLLHSKQISSFMVTNAQFPEAMKNLKPVTQLYVSIDASTKETLKKVDRPLHKDFWERFIASLQELKIKNQRTVYRLTLVKGWNAEEIDNYAKLVALGQPDFIEVKGVTYCGTSKASKLTMENVPWHEEVIYFVQKLTEKLEDYEISCEHEHSNCLLVTHNKFKVNGAWHTWIDYPKFHQLFRAFEESGGTKTFSAVDYLAPTPNWALFGSKERGFDPGETRFHRKNKQQRNDG